MTPKGRSTGGQEPVLEDRSVGQQVLQAQIEKIHRRGVSVRLFTTGQMAWLPMGELVQIGHHGNLQQSDLYQVGQELPVVIFDEAVYRGHREKLVSQVRAQKDPWNEVYLWLENDVKTMEVDLVTGERALGVISSGIRGQVILQTLLEAFPPHWHAFACIRPGDKVTGFVSKEDIDHERRIVTLNVVSFAKSKITVETALSPGLSLGNRQLIPAEISRHEASVGRPKLSHPLRRLLVVDNDRSLANDIKEHLTSYGCEVLLATSEDDAMKVLNTQQEPLDLAIIDIHLHREATDFSGLRVAAEINSQWRDVPVILMTGHEEIYSLTDVPYAEELQVCDLILKPLVSAELLRALTASGNRPRRLKDILAGTSVPEQRLSSNRATWNQQINEVLGEISEEIGAESMVLFSIHPVSMEVRIVARHDPSDRVSCTKANIERSPIRDVALQEEEVFAADASGRYGYPKHRWLQRAYKYRSCVAVKVPVASELAYALFGFHTEPSVFVHEKTERVHQVARQIGSMLYAERTEKRLADVEPYELLGRSYGSMAHDLRGVVSPLAADKLLELLDEKVSFTTTELQAIREKVSTLYTNLSQAAAIVLAFTRVARGALEEEQNVILLDLVRPYVRSLADQYRIVRPEVIVSDGFDLKCRVCVRPTGLRQVLFNLVLNAVQQIDRFPLRERSNGQVVVELTQETRENGPYACIWVHDTGPGIHRGDFSRVFEDGYTTKEDGLGMGLDICRRIVGKTTSKSRKSLVTIFNSILFTGTTFEVSIPVHG